MFLHAGVVAWQGSAIILPGKTFSGKSTLVAELIKLGATYYSDEYAVIGQDMKVRPFPKAISLRTSGNRNQIDVPLEQLGAVIGKRPVPVGLVMITQYRESAHWRPRTVSAGKGLLELLANSFGANLAPKRTMHTLEDLARQTVFLKTSRSEAIVTAPKILSRFEFEFSRTNTY